ncbi:nuclear transport factor 2 family protein [Shewanella submarina]|uniref:Nuclear transport factor 2 family protein n=1 Tax=Shewanella submarina TaxID=2016376 RepID=A0ABV7GEP4_9GAMM|nr:nuclear transport factor 2 family protein [Shewanella submarina]MCL1037876.1 nuclear transport factor 2 family protein [Shewanella submarina]
MLKIQSLLIAILFTCVSAYSHAETPDNKSDTGQIQAMFTTYMAKYNGYLQTGKFDSTNDLYNQEFVYMSNSQAARTMTPVEFMQQAKGFLDTLKTRGVSAVKWESVNIKPLDENVAIASNVALRLRANGKVYNRVGATYLLKNTEQGWRIAAFTIHNADNSMTFN